MATLAYPVTQSTTNKLFGPTIGTSFGNTKPTGKSTNTTITNVNWKWVLDKNKLNGNSVITSTFIKFQIPLDNKKLSSMEFNSAWPQANTAKLGYSKWYANNITGFFKSTSNNQIATIKASSWYPTVLSFNNSAIAPMKSGNVYAGSLVTPYLYSTSVTGSMILVKNTTIGISTNTTGTIHSYNEKILTLKTGAIYAFGELQRHNGWTN
jgi:hypothetical protein